MEYLIQICLALAVTFIGHELIVWSPRLARAVTKLAARRLPPELRERYEEEWLAELEDMPASFCRLLNAFGYLRAAAVIGRRSAHKSTKTRLQPCEIIPTRPMSQPCLAAFIVRERALEQAGSIERICGLLEEEGFNILAVKTLAPQESERVAQQVRGGNWGCGPWPVSGGRPVVVVAGLDVFPKEPDRQLSAMHPGVDNARIFATKTLVRNWWNEQRPAGERCNIVHSADNSRQASLYIQLAMPELNESILQETDRLIRQSRVDGDVVRRFSNNGRRAIVELIRRSDETLVVRKTFRPGRDASMERELQNLVDLHKICPDVVPTVLERGSNYFVVPFHKERRSRPWWQWS